MINPRHWSVEVHCYGFRAKKPFKVSRAILVIAFTSESAFEQAEDFAESTAEVGPEWKSFESVKAVTVKVPLDLETV